MGPHSRFNRELIYENNLSAASEINDFRLEGSAEITFPNRRMRMANLLDPQLGQKSNYVLWCNMDFPVNIEIEWDFWPLREPGLCMLFFAAQGSKGEDIFSQELSKRTGEYSQYTHGDINTYHVSYFRRKYRDERGFHTCNLRKSYGFHLVCQGADPLPAVEDSIAPYHIRLTKYKSKINFYINELPIFSWDDDGETWGPVLGGGKIGFRQMAPMIGEYANLKVYSICSIQE